MKSAQDLCGDSLNGINIGIYHPWLQVGGSECVAIWAAHALYEAGARVTLLGPATVDFGRLDRAFGSSSERWIRDEAIEFHPIKMRPCHRLAGCSAYLRHFDRQARKTTGDFDLVISAYNPINFQRPAIHLLGDFTFDHEVNQAIDPIGTKSGNCVRQIVKQTLRTISSRIFSKSDLREMNEQGHLFVANSNWSKHIMENFYGISRAPVLYPPVPDSPADGNSVSRHPYEFVYIGRISPEKRIERMIRILSEVRDDFPVKLKIIGAVPENSYGRSIRDLAERESDWVTLAGRKVGRDKDRELTAASYAIQGRDNEPFGIAVAEMARAGCIVFCPSNGGQSEIVNHNLLSFSSDEDAVTKIKQLLALPADKQQEIREHVVQSAGRFTLDRFKTTFTKIVNAEWERMTRNSKSGHHQLGQVRSKPTVLVPD